MTPNHDLPTFSADDDFAQRVLGMAAEVVAFEPQTYTSESGDCIEFFVSDEPFVATRIDSFVTVYYSRETGKVVGSIIKGLKKYLKKVLERTPGFKVEMDKGRIKLSRLFTEHLWYVEQDEDGETLVYEQLRDLAEMANVEFETAGMC